MNGSAVPVGRSNNVTATRRSLKSEQLYEGLDSKNISD